MSNYIEQIQTLEKKIKDNELELAKLGEREANLKKEKKEVLTQLKELGISEEDLNAEIDVLENKIKKEIEKIENELK